MKPSPPEKANATKPPATVRFSEDEDGILRKLMKMTGMNLSELVKRAVRFSGPKFLSGEVDVATLSARPAHNGLTVLEGGRA